MTSTHPTDISALNQWIDHLEVTRHDLIQKLHNAGYVIPTDEMREQIGLQKIKVSEIYDWLYRLKDAILITRTTPLGVFELGRDILDSIPDVMVKWDYAEGSEIIEQELTPLSSYLTEDGAFIRYNYGAVGNHTFALYSASGLDEIGNFLFRGNNLIEHVKLTPVINTLGDNLFVQANKLSSIDFGDSRVRKIGYNCIFNTAIKEFTLPDTVQEIYGPTSFNSDMSSFIINDTSQLRKIYNSWVFAIYDKPMENVINLPDGIQLYNANRYTEIRNDNIESWMNYSNPMSRCYSRVSFGTSEQYCSDSYGASYVKDSDGNPIAILMAPYVDEYQIPQTVRYIPNQAFMSLKSGLDLTIPSGITYIHPDFLYWANRWENFTSNGNRYRVVNGDLMTYSKTSFTGEPDVMIYQHPITVDSYSFPESFSCLTDFMGNPVNEANIINAQSNINTLTIPKNFPSIRASNGRTGSFEYNPKDNFAVQDGCLNYSVYDNCLYMGVNGNPYYYLVGVPKNKSSFTIHQSCDSVGDSVFNNRDNLISVDMGDNLRIMHSYTGFRHADNIQTIRFGNGLESLDGYVMFQNMNSLVALSIGTDKGSKLHTIGTSQGQMFGDDPSLLDVWIHSTQVSSMSKNLVPYPFTNTVKFHIHLSDEYGNMTTTYNTFLKNGFSTQRSEIFNTQLVDIDGQE